MKTLTRQQGSLAILTLLILAAASADTVAERFFPMASAPLGNIALAASVFIAVLGSGSFILHRFFSEKPQDKQWFFQPIGWKGALYLYAAYLLIYYFVKYRPGDSLWRGFLSALMMTAVIVAVSRLRTGRPGIGAQASDTQTRQSGMDRTETR